MQADAVRAPGAIASDCTIHGKKDILLSGLEGSAPGVHHVYRPAILAGAHGAITCIAPSGTIP
jgi:hypothetical protein